MMSTHDKPMERRKFFIPVNEIYRLYHKKGDMTSNEKILECDYDDTNKDLHEKHYMAQ